MAEHTRNEYLKALNKMRANYQNNGNVLVNTQDDSTQVGEELSSFAYMNTPAPDIKLDTATNKQTSDRNAWQRSVDTITDTTTNVLNGVLNFFDGLVDAGAYVVGLFGDDDYKQYIQEVQNYDWQSHVSSFLNQVNVVDDILTGDLFDGTYAQKWGDVWDTNAARANLNETHQNSWTNELGTFGEVLTNIEEGIGYVLPSVAVGIATGGASYAATAGRAMLAATGASAFGSGTTQALNSGANYGQAALSGAITGAIEAGTEWASAGLGKAFGKITGKATNFGTRIGGGQFSGSIEKLSLRSLAQSGLEEGLEEVVGALFEPLAEEVYNPGTFAKAWTPGTKENKEMLKEAAISGIAGAAGGMFGGTVSSAYFKSKLGTNGIDLKNARDEIIQETRDAMKHFQKEGNNANFEQIDKVDNKIKEKARQWQEKLLEFKQNEPEHYKNFVKFIQDPEFFLRQANMDTYSRVAEIAINDENTRIKVGTQEQFGTEDKAFIKNGNEIFINPKYKTQFYSLLGHEYVTHAILDLNKEERGKLIDGIKSNEEMKASWNEKEQNVIRRYSDEKTGYISEETKTSETLAAFLEDYITNQKTLNKALGVSEKRGILGILDRVVSSLSRTQDNQFLRQINKTIDNIAKDLKERGSANTRNELAYAKESSKNVDKVNNNEVKLKYENNNGTEDDIRRVLEENRKRNGTLAVSDGIAQGSEWKSQDFGRISELSKRLLREEYDANPNNRGLDLIVDKSGREFLINAPNYTYNTLQKLFKTIDAKTKQMLSVDHTLDEFKNGKLCLMSADGLSTVSVLENGDIINLINANENARGFASKALDLAIKNGGIKMDCYNLPLSETNLINLPYLYSKHGFIPVSGIPYNADFVDELIRDSFSSENNNEPIVFMKYTNNNNPVFENYDEIQKYIHSDDFKLLDDWDEAAKARDDFKPKNTKFAKDLSETNEKKETKQTPSTETYKSIETTKDIVDIVKNSIEKVKGQDIVIHFPKNIDDFVEKSFTQINTAKKLETEAKRITNAFLDTTFEQLDEDTKKYEVIGTLRTALTPAEQTDLETIIKEAIKIAPDTNAKSIETKPFEMQLNKVLNKARDYVNRVGIVRVLTNQRAKVKTQISGFKAITNDEIIRNGLETLLQPIYQLKGNDRGYSAKGVKDSFNGLLGVYNEENITKNFPGLPYNNAIREKIIDVVDSIGEPQIQQLHDKAGKVIGSREVYGSLTTETMSKIIDLTKMIKAEIRHTKEVLIKKAIPNAKQSYKVIENIKYGQKNNVIAGIWRWYKSRFAPSYVLIRQMLGGDSAVANTLTTEMQNAANNKQLYVGDYSIKIDEKLKELGLKKTFDKSKLHIHGYTLSLGNAIFLYNALQVKANYDAINESGIEFLNEDNKLSQTYEVGNAEQLKADLEKLLPDKAKKFGDWLLNLVNNEIKSDYMKWFEDRYGKYQGRNEIGKVGENLYWMLFRSYQQTSNIEKAITNPAGVFSRAKARKGSNNAVLLGDALSSITTYINQLGREIYVKPVYREYISMMNTKVEGDMTLSKLLAQKLSKEDINYIERTVNDLLEVRENHPKSLIAGAMGRFAVAKLGLNLTSTLKQFASIYTSNIPLRQSTKAVIARLFRNKAFAGEYSQLINEIGGLKFRNKNSAAVKGNVDTLTGKAEKIGNAVMKPISWMDMQTITVGVYSLMIIGQDQYGYKIGTNDNKNFVKENWTEFELSQIGSGALSQSGISRGDYGDITKAAFGFMQGANRAALGSQINKLNLFRRNYKVDKATLQEEYNKAKAELDKFKDFDVNNATEEEIESYLETQTKFKDVDMRMKDYKRYEVAGGKKIPLNTAAGLIAQGIFIALINELGKHIKGKKDWDEWDIAELGTNALLAIGVDWVPLVNTIENLIQGYDVSIPAVGLLNQMGDIYQNLSKGNFKSGIRELAILAADMLGLPAETVYQYIYGFVNTFDAEMAWDMKDALYGTSLSSATNTLKSYATNGNLNKSTKMVKLIMSNYKSGSVSDPLAKEMAQLYIDGYNVIPKSTITSYTDEDGNVVSLTKKQIESFKTEYEVSNKMAQQLMYITDYRKSTQEEKGKMMTKLYNAYYEYAKAKATSTSTSSKLGKVLQLTNGRLRIAKYIPSLLKVADITDTKNKTRKELVLSYINKLGGLTKQEKVLLMYLAGYKVSGNSQSLLSRLLINSGANRKEVANLLA